MPELPEVETIRKDLAKLIIGKKILDVETSSPKQVKPSLEVVKKAVVGAKIKKVSRRAKLLQIFLDNGQILAIHLKLTGRLLLRKKGDLFDNWQRVTIHLTENLELRLADLRKFGWIKLVKDEKELSKILSEFGPEPMTDLDLPTFKKILKSSRRPIKIILMDQSKISGIGNIYAVEALFLAKVDPRRPANKLKETESKRLLVSIEKVLKAGIRYRGASDQYYLDALGRKGNYQKHFLVYKRIGEKCFDCPGKIIRISLGGRGTFFCPHCQK